MILAVWPGVCTTNHSRPASSSTSPCSTGCVMLAARRSRPSQRAACQREADEEAAAERPIRTLPQGVRPSAVGAGQDLRWLPRSRCCSVRRQGALVLLVRSPRGAPCVNGRWCAGDDHPPTRPCSPPCIRAEVEAVDGPRSWRPTLSGEPVGAAKVIGMGVGDDHRVHVACARQARLLEPLLENPPGAGSGQPGVHHGRALGVDDGVAVDVAEPGHPDRQLHAQDVGGDLRHLVPG